MFKIIGTKTNKVYATGSEADCFKKIALDYPSHEEEDEQQRRHGGIKIKERVFPEPLFFKKIT